VCARLGDARGGFWRVPSTAHRPRPVDARAAASAASSKSAPPSWGAPGERRVDVVGDGSIRVSEACVSAECWASTRALDERVAHDRLSAAVESDVNFVDAGVPPPDVRGDARFARWLRRRGGRREDLVVGGHLSRGAFAPRESDDEAERTASAVDLKRAYRDVDDAIDRLLLSTGADWIDVLHVPWLAAAPESLRGRRRFERIVSYPLAKDASRTNAHSRVANEFANEKGVHEEAFTTAMDALRWVPLASVDAEKKQNQKQNALLVPTRVSSSSSSSSSAAEARFAAIREAHRRALCDAVRRGKVRTLCVSFETPWDACGLELGDAALYEPSELAELWSENAGPDANQNAHSSQKKTPKRRDGAGSLFLGDAVAGVSLSLSALRDPRLVSRGDDYEATLERWCKPPGFGEKDSFSFERRERRFPVVAARGVFFPDASPLLPAQNANSTEATRASEALLASSMVRAASAFGDFTREDVALGLARARGYAACVAMGAVSSAAATSAMDDETFAARLASFALRDADDDLNMHLDAACLAAVDAARVRHFKGASDAERGKGRGRGRGRDPFEELDEDEEAERR
jgi:hypothetical protein